MAGRNSDEIRCSFCNKTQDQVRKMIAGPSGVYICDHCVEICADIVEEEFEDDAEAFAEERVLTQKEIEEIIRQGPKRLN